MSSVKILQVHFEHTMGIKIVTLVAALGGGGGGGTTRTTATTVQKKWRRKIRITNGAVLTTVS